jgi:glycosyltransferase involved in cell wall biosynthesis
VSIGIPVYNAEAYLEHTIRSILDQTYTDFELVLSDNASTDRSLEICRDFAERDPRIRLTAHPVNQGAQFNFRYVFQTARAPYFRWCASDDYFAPESLEACVATLDANPDAVLCYPGTILVDGEGRFLRDYDDDLDLRMDDPVERYRQVVARIVLVNVIYGLIRSDAVRRTGLISHFFGADQVFVAELALQGKFLAIDRPLFYRRMHEAASSSMHADPERLQTYLDPKRAGRPNPLLWYTLFERLKAPLRAPISLADRLRLAKFVLRAAIMRRDEYAAQLPALLGRKSRA